MKIKNKQMLGLVAALLLACPAVHARRATMRVEVTNSSKMPRTDEPVVFNLKDIGEVKRAVVTLNGKEIPSQLDDLDGDCVYDELCFLTDVGAHETKNYRVELFDDGEQKTFPARTFAELVLPSKDKKLPKTKLMKWKLKATCKNITGETLAFLTYKKPVLLNCHLKFDPNQHFHIPELGIDGDYLHAFRKMTEITWKLNEVTGRECRHLADNLQLPQEYVGCQIRGGDKITETNLLPAEYYIRLIKQKTDLRDVFVLTDDYRIFRQVQSLAPDIRWYTLCDSGEKGYVNSAFTQTTKELKQKQMTRFLSSIQLLMNASIFTGSITTGPSLFLLKKFYPDISPADCLLEDFPQAATLPIPGRSQMAAEFLQGNLKL